MTPKLDPKPESESISVAQHRAARKLAYRNGLIWAAGNGLIGSTLIRYMILDIATSKPATGSLSTANSGFANSPLHIGLIVAVVLAAPHFSGLLRLLTPTFVNWFGSRRRFCISAYLGSCMVVMALPMLPMLDKLLSPSQIIWAIAGIWCLYHLLEYMATAAFWSWLADLVPTRVRGRFIGRRQLWMTLGQTVTMLISGLFIYQMHDVCPGWPRWVPYAISGIVGTLIMALSIIPIARMPDVAVREQSTLTARCRQLIAPLRDPMFLRLLVFGCWLSFANGITQSAQGIFPYALSFPVLIILGLRSMMRTGQLLISPTLGRVADRWGNRRLLIVSLPIVAAGPLFYLAASISSHWWLIGAWIAWIAWAGLNVGLPNLMLRLSPDRRHGSSISYVAAYFAITGLFYALSTLAGGLIFDYYNDPNRLLVFVIPGIARTFDIFQISMIYGWLLRTSGVLLLLWVVREER